MLMHGRPPRALIPLAPASTTSIAQSASIANANAKSKILEAKKQVEQHNTGMIAPFSIGEIVLVNNPVIPRGPGAKRMHLPFTKQRRIVGIRLPNTLELVPHPDGGPIEKVNMHRVKRAPSNLQQATTATVNEQTFIVRTNSPPESESDSDSIASEPPAPRPILKARTPRPQQRLTSDADVSANPRTPSTTTKFGRQVFPKVRFG